MGKTTITPVLWTKPNKDNQYPLKIRITRNRKSSYISLGIEVDKEDWDNHKKEVKKSNPRYKELNTHIRNIVYQYLTTNGLIKPNLMDMTSDDRSSIRFVFDFRIKEAMANGKVGHKNKLSVVRKHLINSGLSGTNVNEFDISHIIEFNHFLTNVAKVKPQGRHSYLKYLRTTLRVATDLGIKQSSEDPFYAFKMPKGKPKRPRSLSGKQIHQLEVLLLKQHQHRTPLFDALSTFLFSFFSYGMRFSDVVRLRYSDMEDGVINYNMIKTDANIQVAMNDKLYNLIKPYLPDELYPKIFKNGKYLGKGFFSPSFLRLHPIVGYECTYHELGLVYFSRLEKNDPVDIDENGRPRFFTAEENATYFEAQKERDKLLMEIVNRYSAHNDGRIFPLINDDYDNLDEEYKHSSSRNTIINKQLKDVAKMIDISPFTFHSARHSFANNIRMVDGDILRISRMLGHKDLSVTQSYLQRFDNTETYDANSTLVETQNRFYAIQQM